MKKLLQINHVLSDFGSTGKIVNQIGDAAIRDGWESYIAYGRWGCKSHSHLIKIGNSWDVACHGLLTRLTDRHGLYSSQATRQLIKQIETVSPDLIHLHCLHGYYLNYQLLFNYLKTVGIPIVWTLHDCWPFTGHCAHFTRARCNKWKTQCHHCPIRNDYPSSFRDGSKENYRLKKESFTNIPNMTIVTVSDWLKSVTHESFLGNYKIQTIYNGTDTNIFRPHKSQPNSRFTVLGVAGMWYADKGLYDFYKLRKQLSPLVGITLIGLNDKQMRTLPKGITGRPKTQSADELAQAYSDADIVVNLSYQETFGMTTAEGMACGTPCIVYNTTACPELITPDTGTIVPLGNIKQVAKAIMDIRKRGKASYTDKCRTRAVECFDKNKQYNKYITLYNSLIK